MEVNTKADTNTSLDLYQIDLNATLKNKVGRETTALFVSFFYILEDLKMEGVISQEEYNRYRKRVLDYGNNAIRNITQDIDNLDISFKKK